MKIAVLSVTTLLTLTIAAAAATRSLPIVDGAARAKLRASSVPVLLPLPPPRMIGPLRSIAVITAGHSGYYVGFSPLANCGGGLSCAFFHVAGYPDEGHIDRSYRRDRNVRLPDRRRGFFRPRDCSGASCTEASLTFERRGAIYEIDARAGGGDLALLVSAYRAMRLLRPMH